MGRGCVCGEVGGEKGRQREGDEEDEAGEERGIVQETSPLLGK